MLYTFGKIVTMILVRLLFRVRYEGLEYIPRNSGFILASNHRSYWDPVFIAHKVPGDVHYMAKGELFHGVFGWLIGHLKAFPVYRGEGRAEEAVGAAAALVGGGGVLGIFPEGTRSRDGKPLRPRSGVAMIAIQSGADVLPVAVCYGDKLGWRTPVTVRYGPLIPASELAGAPEDRRALREGARRIMQGILTELEKGWR